MRYRTFRSQAGVATSCRSRGRRRGLLEAWLAVVVLGVGLVLVSGPGVDAQTAPIVGSLDTSFDSDGKVTTGFETVHAEARAYSVAVQPDGKIVAAGYSYNGSDTDFAVARYNADGSLDTGFGTGGRVTTPIGASDDVARSVVVQSDGKIVAAGDSYNGSNDDFAVVRYNADGSLDTGFGSGGKRTTAIGTGNDVANSVAVQSDGKIVVAGHSDNDFAAARFSADGSLDTGFDSDGKVTTAIGTSIDVANSVAVQSDGKIVVAGYSHNGTNFDLALVQYNSDGSLDTSFDTDGKVTTAIGTSDDFAFSVAVQSDGKIVVAGSSYNGSNDDIALARYNSDGSLDTGFDTDGKVTTAIGSSHDHARSVVVQSDGKIVAAGRSHNGSNSDFAVVRYSSDGSLDTGFDTDGMLTTAIGSGDDVARSVALPTNGKIVVAGYSDAGGDDDFAVVRYNADGSLDTGFDSDGKITTPIGTGDDRAFSVAVQSDGKIVSAGYSHNGSNNDFAVVRYNADGSLDTGFGAGGMVTTAIGSRNDVALSVAVLSDGKIVAAGYSHNGSNNDFAVVRYNADGSLDTGFDTDGMVTTAIGSGDDRARSVAVLSDGKIVAAGSSDNGSDNDFAVVRYNANGALDTAFDSDGKVTTDIGSADELARSVAVQSDGKIVAAGSGDGVFAVVRYNANGSLDTGFDTDGKVTTVVGDSSGAHSMAVQPDNKIVVAGFGGRGATPAFAVVRYNANGSLDTGFDADGKVTTDITTQSDLALSVVVQSDGKIVAAGYGDDGPDDDFALVRYNSNGSLDDTGFDRPAFGTDGKVTTRFETVQAHDDRAYAVALQSDGRIVAAGYRGDGSDPDFALVRYNSDGSLDTRFGTDGKVTTAIGSGDEFAFAVAVQSDGKIVAAGYSHNGSNDDFALVRYNSDGSLDTGFGTGGKVTTAIGSASDVAESVVVLSDGKIVAAGSSHNGSNFDFALARYNSDGSLDTSFGTGGKVTTDLGSRHAVARSVAVQPDGKIVAAGLINVLSQTDFVVVRYNADGSLDTGFGTGGFVITEIVDSGNENEAANSVVVQSDGKIVIAGARYNGSNDDFAVVRYNSDGSLDTGFDADGKVTTEIGSGDDVARSMVVQSDGKIVVAGESDNGADHDVAVVRYNSDGSLDTGFDSDGKATAAIGSGHDDARSVVVQSDGKIVAAGSSFNGNDRDFAVVRWHGKVPSRPPVQRPVYTPPPPPPERFDLEVRRVGGVDRFETSALLAGEYATLAGRLDAVVLASGANFPDALSASALAGALDAPLLYVGPGGLPEQVAEFIRDHSVAKVYIVGGEAAVSAEVQTEAEALEPVQAVTRISGADRYGTSVEVASRVARLGAGVGGWCGGAKTVLLANGAGFADALSASPAAAAGPHPLLLTSTGALPETVASWLSAAVTARTVEQVVIVGGEAAVSSDVEGSIDALGIRTVRIAGADRYSTSAEFARRTECTAKNHLAAATGVDYADGLTAGPLLARLGGALVLVQPETVPDPVSDYAAATRRFRGTTGSTLWILGGRAAINNDVKTALRNTIRDANTR